MIKLSLNPLFVLQTGAAKSEYNSADVMNRSRVKKSLPIDCLSGPNFAMWTTMTDRSQADFGKLRTE